MSIKHCANLLYNNDKDKFLTLSFVDVEVRKKLLPLYAFYIEISKIPWMVKEKELAEIRYMWWFEKINKIYSSDEKAEHPILFSLSKVIKENNLPLEKFLKIIETRKLDLQKKPYKNFNDQINYFFNSSGSIMELAYNCNSKKKETGLICAKNFGYLQGVSTLISNLPILLNTGKEAIFFEENLKKGLQDLVKYSLNVYQENVINFSILPKNHIVSFLPAAFSINILKKAEEKPDIFLNKGYKMSILKKRYLLLRSFYLKKI